MTRVNGAKQAILDRLAQESPLAIHELAMPGLSENNAATRMSELHADGMVVGRRRKDKAFKEWRRATPEEIAIFIQQTKLRGESLLRKCPHCYGTGRVAA